MKQVWKQVDGAYNWWIEFEDGSPDILLDEWINQHQ